MALDDTLSANQIAVFHDQETSYGTGGNPGQAAKALLAFNADPPNMQGDNRTRQHVKGYFGARPFLIANKRYNFPFSIEAQGSGTAGASVAYSGMLNDAGMAETLVSGTANVSTLKRSVGTPTGAFTFTVATQSDAKVMRVVTLECTTPGGTGVAAFTVSAPATGKGDVAEAAYSVTGVVMTDATAFALPNSAEITPTITTDFVAGDKFEIDIGPDRAEYDPTSDRTNHDSGNMYWRYDNIRHAITGCRSGLAFTLEGSQFPFFRFPYTGLYSTPTKEAMPDVNYDAFRTPKLANVNNTWLCELFGQELGLQRVEIDWGNQIGFTSRVGRQAVRINDRNVTANIVFEAPDLATKNFFTEVDAHNTGTFRLCHGITAGEVIELVGHKVQIGPIQETESEGDIMLSTTLTFLPLDDAQGDDEIKFLAY